MDVGLSVGTDRRDELGEPPMCGVLAQRNQHLLGDAGALTVGANGDLNRRDRVGPLATQAGQQPAADHEVPAVVGQGRVSTLP